MVAMIPADLARLDVILYALITASGHFFRELVCLVHDPAEKILHLLLIALPVVKKTKQLVTSDREREGRERERERERERDRR